MIKTEIKQVDPQVRQVRGTDQPGGIVMKHFHAGRKRLEDPFEIWVRKTLIIFVADEAHDIVQNQDCVDGGKGFFLVS